jgi:hypothetical protein
MPYGNHARGAKFTDASHSKAGKYYQWNVFTNSGFFFGRMDVMYNSFAELENGKTSLL